MKGKKLLMGLAAIGTVVAMSGCGPTNISPEPENPSEQEVEATIVGISATMNKTTYVEGDLLSLAGLKVTATYSDNTTKEITGYSTNHEEGYELQLGDKLVITLGSYSCEINLTITEKNVVLERITASITKTSYYEGQTLGLVTVKGTYSNGTEQTIAGGYSILINDQVVGANHAMVLGENKLKVTYQNLTSNEITLTVMEDTVVSISVSNNFREFAPEDEFVKETVTATYASGKTGTVDAEFTGYDMSTTGVQTVTVTYGTLTPITYEIEVDEKYSDKVAVVISAQVSEVERHDTVTVSIDTLRNAETSDVSFTVVSGAATITNAGVVTIKDDAVVGSKVKIKATAKEVDSNVLELTVKDTFPTAVSLNATKTVLKDNETITLTPEFTPSYATKTDVNYNLKGDGKDSVEVVNGVLKFKQGSSMYDHITEKFSVEVVCSDATSVKVEKEFTIGFTELALSVDSASFVIPKDSTDSIYVNVSAEDEDGEVEIDKTKLTFSSENEDVLTIDEKTGKVTIKGCGTSKITAKLTDSISSTTTYTVVIPPDEIIIDGYKQVAIEKGLKTGVGEDNKIKSPFIAQRDDSYVFSDTLEYEFKLYDEEHTLLSEDSDDIATVDKDGFITFKQTGYVEATAKSNSTIGYVEAGGYEKSKTAKFVVNEGVNIYDLPNLHFALFDTEVKGVNLMNDIYFEKMTDIEVEGKGTYSSVMDRYGNEKFLGLVSRGDKDFEGNGYKLSLEKLELATITNVEAAANDAGDDLLEFYAAGYDNGEEPTSDVICEPYHVEVRDLTVVGQSDYQGDYLGTIEELNGRDVALGKFVQSFRRGVRVGGSNAKAGFSTFDSKTSQPKRDYQKCAKAYVDAPIIENLTIQGFETGLRSEHVVDGYYEGLDIKDCYNNASEVNQCIVEYHNTKIRQVGGFAIEVVPDGMDMTNIFKDGELNIDFKEAGVNYDQLPEVKMTGSIDAINMNDGSSTERMTSLKLGDFTIKDIVLIAVQDMIKKVCDEIGDSNESYSFLKEEEYKNKVIGLVTGKLLGVMYNANQQIDFFTLMFLYEYNNFLKRIPAVIMGSDIVNFQCENEGKQSDAISLHDLIQNIIVTYLTKGENVDYEGYKSFKYIIFDLNGDTIESKAANLGTVVLVNLGYDASYIPE